MLKLRISGFTDVEIASDIKAKRINFTHDIEYDISKEKSLTPVDTVFKLEAKKADELFSKYNEITVNIDRMDLLDKIKITKRGR